MGGSLARFSGDSKQHVLSKHVFFTVFSPFTAHFDQDWFWLCEAFGTPGEWLLGSKVKRSFYKLEQKGLMHVFPQWADELMTNAHPDPGNVGFFGPFVPGSVSQGGRLPHALHLTSTMCSAEQWQVVSWLGRDSRQGRPAAMWRCWCRLPSAPTPTRNANRHRNAHRQTAATPVWCLGARWGQNHTCSDSVWGLAQQSRPTDRTQSPRAAPCPDSTHTDALHAFAVVCWEAESAGGWVPCGILSPLSSWPGHRCHWPRMRVTTPVA